MTPDDVRQRIAEFAPYAQADPEHFHGERDRLYLDVLRACAAGGHKTCDELAGVALEADKIEPAWDACA